MTGAVVPLAARISAPEMITRKSGGLSTAAGLLETMHALASVRLPLASIKGIAWFKTN